MKVYDAASIRNVALVGHSASGKPSSPPPSSPTRAWSIASAKSTKARPSPTSTKKKSRASTPCRPASPTRSGTSRRSTSSTRRASATSWPRRAPRSRWPTPPSWSSTRCRGRWCRPRRCGPRPTSSTCRASSSSTGWTANAPASSARSRRCARCAIARSCPIQLPIGEEKSFKGVVDLVTKKAFVYQTDESGKFAEGPVPADMTAAVDTAREALIEMVAETDEQLMEKFFEAGTLTDEELVAGLQERDRGREALPAGLHVRDAEHRRPAAARRDPRLLPSPAERPVQGRRQERRRSRAARRREAPARGVRVEDDRRSVRRPHHDVPRRLRHVQVRFDRAEQDQGRAGAARQPRAAAGQDADDRSRDQGRRPRARWPSSRTR